MSASHSISDKLVEQALELQTPIEYVQASIDVIAIPSVRLAEPVADFRRRIQSRFDGSSTEKHLGVISIPEAQVVGSWLTGMTALEEWEPVKVESRLEALARSARDGRYLQVLIAVLVIQSVHLRDTG